MLGIAMQQYRKVLSGIVQYRNAQAWYGHVKYRYRPVTSCIVSALFCGVTSCRHARVLQGGATTTKYFIRLDEVCFRLSVSRTTIWRWRQNAGFPHPKTRGLYSVAEIEQWVQQHPLYQGENNAAEKPR